MEKDYMNAWYPVRMRPTMFVVGFILVPEAMARSRRPYVLPVREPMTTTTWSGDSMPYPKATVVTMPIRVKLDDYGQELFIDAEDFPLDVWRRVAGFMEVVPPSFVTAKTTVTLGGQTASTTVTLSKTEDKPQPTVRKRKRLELDL